MPNSWWMAEAWNNSPAYLVSWVVWVVVSIVIHELAHGWVAIRCGDDVPLHSGHMTINPFVHIPPMAWIIFLLLGFTWGLMPTNPANYRRRYDEALMAFAGPLSNLIQAVVLSLACVLYEKHGVGLINDEFYRNMVNFLFIGTVINIVGFGFNMLPVPPLDGSRILGNFVPAFDRLWRKESAQGVVLVVGLGLMFVGGRFVWPIGRAVADSLVTFWERMV